jgi:predicted CoA-binding protein
MENVAIIGASTNKERYSHRAQNKLVKHGHKVFPVNPYGGEILGEHCYTSITEIKDTALDTVTIYVNPERLAGIVDDIIATKPKRVIFNPDTEDNAIMEKVAAAGIKVVTACTLVMLRRKRF